MRDNSDNPIDPKVGEKIPIRHGTRQGYLMLTRFPGQAFILILENAIVEIEISKFYEHSVAIAVKAPKDVKILRKEIWKKEKAKEKQ